MDLQQVIMSVQDSLNHWTLYTAATASTSTIQYHGQRMH